MKKVALIVLCSVAMLLTSFSSTFAAPKPKKPTTQAVVPIKAGSPKAAIGLQLKLIKAGNVDALRGHFTKRQQKRITERAVKAGQRELKKYTLNTLVHSVRLGSYRGKRTAKIKMKNGRTLTTLVYINKRWLADTVWFR